MISVIKSEAQYREVLARVTALVELDPVAESEEGRELELLAVLLREYERQSFPIGAPSPIAAIRFRMEQQGLGQRDLVPMLGSKSRVSEVLAGKRPLTVPMVRELHSRLGIPLEALVAEERQSVRESFVDWERFPVREMIRRGWFDEVPVRTPARLQAADFAELVEMYFRPVGGLSAAVVALHKTDVVRTARSTDPYALAAWTARVRRRADSVRVADVFNVADWHAELFRELRGLTRFRAGPQNAVELLRANGVVVVIEPHLSRTRLDGAAMLRSDGVPVIALTLRHDRVDNFWFTLFHELMHVVLHLKPRNTLDSTERLFLDDLDVTSDMSDHEREADYAAREALIPRDLWNASAVRHVVAPATARELARQAGVGEAIVAGRVRFEKNNYRLLAALIGTGEVQVQFPEVGWEKIAE